MPVVRLVVGPLESNTYLVSEGEAADCLVVDAGGEAERVADEIASRGLRPRVLFLTHGHVDHSAAARELKERFPEMGVAILRQERDLLFRPSHNLSLFLGGAIEPPEPDSLLDEGDEVEAGGLRMRVIHVPGHTPGGACLCGKVDGQGVLFAGDALFAGSIGRVDFPGGDERTLLSAIREKLLSLPDETVVWPGHGPGTTIGEERRSNPFLLNG
jgi:glyoxylase-like metal-dependent hydrolase (beta-lactamase superfamily II)